MSPTNQNMNYQRCKAKKRWRSIDAYSQNGVVTVLLSFSLIKAANTLIMHNSDLITIELPYLQEYK